MSRLNEGFELDAEPTDLVEHLIQRVAERYSSTSADVKLIYKQLILKVGLTLEQCKLVDGAVINVTVKPSTTAAAPPPVQKIQEEDSKTQPTQQSGNIGQDVMSALRQQVAEAHQQPNPQPQSVPPRPEQPQPKQPKLEPRDKHFEDYPRTYSSTLIQTTKIEPYRPKGDTQQTPPVQNQPQPRPAPQQPPNQQNPQMPTAQNIPPELILSLEQNPLLPDYVEDLLQHPERVEEQLKNPKFQELMREFFGGDPMAAASLGNPKTFIEMMKQSQQVYKQQMQPQQQNQQPQRPQLNAQPQQNDRQQAVQGIAALRNKWGEQLRTIQEMGIEFDEAEALQLLEQFKGNVEQVINVILGM